MNSKSFLLISTFIALLAVAVGVFVVFLRESPEVPRTENMGHNIPQQPPPPPTTNEKPANNNEEVKPEIVWGDQSKKQVIFTFDGGAGNQSVGAILDVLKKHGVRGTFFLTGTWAQTNRAFVERISSEGHEIFNHTYSHADLTKLSDEKIVEEFQKTETIIRDITGKSTKPYFRPPYGARNADVRAVAAREGYQSVYWTIDALDWKEDQGFTAEQVKERIFSNLKPGTIYMMHIGDTITGRILDEVFTKIKSEGYTIVSLTQGL